MSVDGPLVRLAALALPAHARDAILGDLREEAARDASARGGPGLVRTILAIACRYHADCYRDVDDRVRIAVLLAFAMAVVVAVPPAARTLLAGAAVFEGSPLASWVQSWQAPHVTAGLAAGLVVGRAPWLAAQLAPARSHVAAVLVVVALAMHGFAGGLAATVAFLAAQALAARHRRDADDDAKPA